MNKLELFNLVLMIYTYLNNDVHWCDIKRPIKKKGQRHTEILDGILIVKLPLVYLSINWSLAKMFPLKIICFSIVGYSYQLTVTMTFS